MKAIIIARVSTEEQREAGNSLPAQLERLKRYCQNKEFEILRTYSFDESAYKGDREKFDCILDTILNQTERVAICFDKVDRLSRDPFDERIAKLRRKALSGNIEIHFASEGRVFNSQACAPERFQFTIGLGLAEYYSAAISDNVKRAQEQKIRKGEWLSKAPFGYKNIMLENDNTDIIINEHNAHIVKKVFELYAGGSYSMELLCKKVKADFGLSWAKGYLGKLLKNPFYHGVMIIKGKAYPHRYPPIISKSLFDEAQERKEEFKKKPFKYMGLPFLYRGLIRCDDCGLSISPEKHKGYAYYHCTQFRGKHGAKWLREEELTKQFGEVFKSLQMPQHIHEEIVKSLQEVHHYKIEFHNQQLAKLTKAQKQLAKMMDNLYLDKLKGKIDDAQFDRFHESFTQQKDDVNSRLERLSEAENNYYITAKHVLDLTNRAYDWFMSSEVEEKRQLIKLVLQNVHLNGERLVYEARSPFDQILNASDGNLWRG